MCQCARSEALWLQICLPGLLGKGRICENVMHMSCLDGLAKRVAFGHVRGGRNSRLRPVQLDRQIVHVSVYPRILVLALPMPLLLLLRFAVENPVNVSQLSCGGGSGSGSHLDSKATPFDKD